jgi:hypothetical protein
MNHFTLKEEIKSLWKQRLTLLRLYHITRSIMGTRHTFGTALPTTKRYGPPLPPFFVSVDYRGFKFFVSGSADFKAVIVRLCASAETGGLVFATSAKRKTIALAFEIKPSGSLGSGVEMFFADKQQGFKASKGKL